jgi:hypothetical protein
MDPLVAIRSRLADSFEPPRVVEPWSVGVTMMHCAQSIDSLIDGFPQPRSIIVRRVAGPMAAKRFIRKGVMSHDTAAPIPGLPEIDPATTWETGRDRLVAAIDRYLGHRGPLQEHFAYGRLTYAQGARLNALHIENHLRRDR